MIRELKPPTESLEDLRRRVTELSALYEVARELLEARTQRQVAFRVVLCGIRILGARSGALFVADGRDRYRLLYASAHGPKQAEVVELDEGARDWLLRERNASLPGAAAARALGPLRDRLVESADGAIIAAIPDAHGLAGFMLFGPKLLEAEFDDEDRALLGSLPALAAEALAAHAEKAAGSARRTPGGTRHARSLETLRAQHEPLRSMVGESPALLETCQDLMAVAETHFPALLSGESGVGKELAARAIHELSDRAEGPFEIVDCGSIPRELIESELFGHVRGAFTGAHRDRRGAFELAHRGSLFLDEIGEMPLQLQTRLLRVLQEKRFRRVGDERVIEVDVRVLAATNRDLKAEVVARRFRDDLYYRLNVFAVRIPPLRERGGDIVPLMKHFLAAQAGASHRWELGSEVAAALESYSWPGNVRELGNLCAALGVRARGREIGLDDLDHVWRRQHPGEEPPWRGGPPAGRGALGDWVLEQARASRFNLVEASRLLRRRSRSGQSVPLTERSALAYYLTGEILRALVTAGGDVNAAARAVAGEEDLVPRVATRVQKVREGILAAGGDREAVRGRFAKLPSDYSGVLEQASRLVRRA